MKRAQQVRVTDQIRDSAPEHRRALLDVNVLIALLDGAHISHQAAMSWLTRHARGGWASCPITQNGCVRIMSSAGYPNALPVPAIMDRLAEACKQGLHEFWPDSVSLLDPRRVDATRIHGARQLTDVYLLTLAVEHEARFVTFGTRITTAAVRRAAPEHLIVI
jgi:uncharacterized protein